jgi:hypothetical protein
MVASGFETTYWNLAYDSYSGDRGSGGFSSLSCVGVLKIEVSN